MWPELRQLQGIGIPPCKHDHCLNPLSSLQPDGPCHHGPCKTIQGLSACVCDRCKVLWQYGRRTVLRGLPRTRTLNEQPAAKSSALMMICSHRRHIASTCLHSQTAAGGQNLRMMVVGLCYWCLTTDLQMHAAVSQLVHSPASINAITSQAQRS